MLVREIGADTAYICTRVLNRTGGRTRCSMVAPPSAVAALQSLHTLPNTSPSTSNTRRTPRRTLAGTPRRPLARLVRGAGRGRDFASRARRRPKRAAVLPQRRPGCTHTALRPSPGDTAAAAHARKSRLPDVPLRRIVSGERPRRKSPVNCARRAVRVVKERAAEEHGARTRRESVRARSELGPKGCAITPLSLTLLEVDRLARLGRTH